jgi:hypothetical protein
MVCRENGGRKLDHQTLEVPLRAVGAVESGCHPEDVAASSGGAAGRRGRSRRPTSCWPGCAGTDASWCRCAADPADRRGANGVTSFRVMDPNPADRAHFRLPVGPGLVDTSRPHCRARGRRARAAGCPGRRRRRCSCSTRWAPTLPSEIGARQWFDLRKRQDRRFPADDADGPARRRLADRLVVSGSDRRRLCRIARRTRRGRGPSRRP